MEQGSTRARHRRCALLWQGLQLSKQYSRHQETVVAVRHFPRQCVHLPKLRIGGLGESIDHL